MPFYQECIQLLNAQELSFKDAKKVISLYVNMVPLTSFYKVDWSKITTKVALEYDYATIIPSLEKLLQGSFDTSVYLQFDRGPYCIIKTDLKKIIEHFEDVRCVSDNEYIFNLTTGYVIELLFGSGITLGVVPVPLPMSTLFTHALKASNIMHLSQEQCKEIQQSFVSQVPFTDQKTVDWSKIEHKFFVEDQNPKKLLSTMKKLMRGPFFNKTIYSMWNGDSIATSFDSLVQFLDTVPRVSFHAFIFNPDDRYIIELNDDGEIIVGRI